MFFVIFYFIFVNYLNVNKLFLALKFSQKDKFDLNIIEDDVDLTEVKTIKKLKDEEE